MPETNTYSNCGWLFPNNNSAEGAGKVGIELPIWKAIRSFFTCFYASYFTGESEYFAPPKVKE